MFAQIIIYKVKPMIYCALNCQQLWTTDDFQQAADFLTVWDCRWQPAAVTDSVAIGCGLVIFGHLKVVENQCWKRGVTVVWRLDSVHGVRLGKDVRQSEDRTCQPICFIYGYVFVSCTLVKFDGMQWLLATPNDRFTTINLSLCHAVYKQ